MYRLLSPFWNRQEGRIRSGWRIMIHLICYLMAQLSPSILLGVPHDDNALIALGPLQITSLSLFIFLGMIAVVITTWLIGVVLDRRPFAEFGFQMGGQWWKELLFGALLGALLMALIFAAEWLLGWIEVTEIFHVKLSNLSFAMAFISPIMLFTAVAIQEELLSRGYEIRNFAEGICFSWLGERGAIAVAWVITSTLFGLLHFFNPNATWISTFNIALAGIFLGLGYVLTGRLALSIGLHLTWNLFQGNIFGFPVSGNEFNDVTLFAIKQGGPTLWTGGAFGPEAGLIGVIALIIGSVLILGWLRWQEGSLGLHQPIAYYNGQRAWLERKVRGIA